MRYRSFLAYSGVLLLIAACLQLTGCAATPTSNGASSSTVIITGILMNVTQASGEVRADALNSNWTKLATYYPDTHLFEVVGAPTNDTIYFKAVQYNAAHAYTTESFAYNRISVETSSVFAVVTFETMVTVDANCTVHSGYTMEGYGIYIYNKGKNAFQLYSTGGSFLGASFPINRLPPLIGDDTYTITLTEKNASNDGLQKEFYNVTAGVTPFNMATPEIPVSSFIVFPPDSTTFTTGNPTFEWQPMWWADHYLLRVYTEDMHSVVWTVSTTETEIEMPGSVVASAGSGDFRFEVEVHPVAAFSECYFQNGNLPKFTIP